MEATNILLYVGLMILAYFIGSLSAAIWVSKTFFHIDIRQYGSKNAGATNVQRVLGWKAGLPVFIWDFAKGVLAVCLILITPLDKHPVPENPLLSNYFVAFQIALGLAVVAGHIFPLFSGFKGGKGVATMAGVILAIFPAAMLMVLGVFLICLLITRYVSLSSIAGAIVLPFIVIVVFGCWMGTYEPLTLQIFSVLVTVMILLTHRNNIKRLLKGEEQPLVIRKKPAIDEKGTK